MIGTLPARVVVLGLLGVVLAIGALGAASIGTVTSVPVYLLALLLGLASVVAVLLPWRPATERLLAPAVVVAVIGLGLLVVPVLPEGRPGYALWFPGFVWIPLSGLALRGHPLLAGLGALGSAATTLAWAATEADVGLEDGVYRVVSPTAVVVVAVGIELLVRQYRAQVEQAHAEQLAAARLSAGARAAEAERRLRLAEVAETAAPVLRRLRDEGRADELLRAECRLLEASLRDGIRGRFLVDASVQETVWAARRRGVTVTLLDDSGSGAADPPPVAELARRCTVQLVEKVESGSMTVRVSSPTEATIVALTPEAAEMARSCRSTLAQQDELRGLVHVEETEDPDEGTGEMLLTIRSGPRPTTTPPAGPAATATGPT